MIENYTIVEIIIKFYPTSDLSAAVENILIKTDAEIYKFLDFS